MGLFNHSIFLLEWNKININNGSLLTRNILSEVCIVRKDGTVKQRWMAKCGWGCANGKNKKTLPNLSTLPNWSQKNKKTSPKKWRRPHIKMKTNSPKKPAISNLTRGCKQNLIIQLKLTYQTYLSNPTWPTSFLQRNILFELKKK